MAGEKFGPVPRRVAIRVGDGNRIAVDGDDNQAAAWLGNDNTATISGNQNTAAAGGNLLGNQRWNSNTATVNGMGSAASTFEGNDQSAEVNGVDIWALATPANPNVSCSAAHTPSAPGCTGNASFP